jgi:hypothetical protein
MSASTIRTLVFMAFAVLVISAFLFIPTGWLSYPAIILLVLAAWIVPERVFERIATPEEKHKDLEERARNFPD